MTAHASFSPSAAHRVVTCPASWRLSIGAPRTSNWNAVEGTIAHAIHESCLADDPKREPVDFFGRDHHFAELSDGDLACVPEGWSVPIEMVEAVAASVEACREIAGDCGIVMVEQRVDISAYTPIPGQFGTSDCIIYRPDTKTLYVIDYKHGMGVRVDAERNHQGALYALGALEAMEPFYDVEKVVIRIHQPRIGHMDQWVTTPKELREFGDEMLARFHLAVQPDPPFHPDDKACRWCPAADNCPARAARAQQLAAGMFEVLEADILVPRVADEWPTPPAPDGLTLEQIAAALAVRSQIEDFFKACYQRAYGAALAGETVPGMKLVDGRASRAWAADEKAVVEAFTKHPEFSVNLYSEPELLSPPQVEKQLKGKAAKEFLASLVSKQKGEPKLVPESDKRESVEPSSTQFTSIE